MQRKIQTRLELLPKTEASFIEPRECLSVTKLPEGAQWFWEILCDAPHKTSVASAVIWRWGAGPARKTHGTASGAT